MPLQVRSPSQSEFGSSLNLSTGAQVPTDPNIEHDWHSPHAALAQQTPSTQLPDAQSPVPTHAAPSGWRHAPAWSHTRPPLHMSSAASLTAEQTPTFPVSVQLLHAPSHAASQQTPSTQKPVEH
jgi:hypothetical protein